MRKECAWLISEYNATRGIFDYHHKPTQEKQRAIAEYCDSVQKSFIEKQLSTDESQPKNSANPSKQDYDSCQQWRSAEFTEKSAYYAAWQGIAGIVGALIGFGTLVAAIVAAYFAGRAAYWAQIAARAGQYAAHQAQRSAASADVTAHHAARQAEAAIEQVKIMRRDQRPWIIISKMAATGNGIALPNGYFQIPVEVHVENVGTTLATEVRAILYPFFAGAYEPILMEPERITTLVPPQSSDPASIYLEPNGKDKIRVVLHFDWNGDDRLFEYTNILAIVTYNDKGDTGEVGCAFNISRRDLLSDGMAYPRIDRLETVKHWVK